MTLITFWKQISWLEPVYFGSWFWSAAGFICCCKIEAAQTEIKTVLPEINLEKE